MSNVESVITTTNTIVDSANAAVSRGRWSNLAIIASFFFLSLFGKAAKTPLLRLRGFWVHLGLGQSLTPPSPLSKN